MRQSKAHDREHLGLGGRRVLVSRQWTGKTLTDHRADRAEVIRQTLAAAGVEMDDQNALSAHTDDDESPRFIWHPSGPATKTCPRTRKSWPTHHKTHPLAQAVRGSQTTARDGTGPPTDSNSATDQQPATTAA